MKQGLLMKLGDFVILVSEGEESSKAKDRLLVVIIRRMDFDKEGYVVESERFWLVCVTAEGCPSGVDAAFRGSCRCV